MRVRVGPQKGFDAVKALSRKFAETVVMPGQAGCGAHHRGCRARSAGGGAGGSWLGGSVRLFTTEWAEGTLEGYAGRERRKNGRSSRWKPLFAKKSEPCLVDSSTTDLHIIMGFICE